VLAYLAFWPWLDRHIYVHDDYERGKDFGNALSLVYSLPTDSNRLQGICSKAAPLIYGTSEPINSEVSFLWDVTATLEGAAGSTSRKTRAHAGTTAATHAVSGDRARRRDPGLHLDAEYRLRRCGPGSDGRSRRTRADNAGPGRR
jgi:hypothetical protein